MVDTRSRRCSDRSHGGRRANASPAVRCSGMAFRRIYANAASDQSFRLSADAVSYYRPQSDPAAASRMARIGRGYPVRMGLRLLHIHDDLLAGVLCPNVSSPLGPARLDIHIARRIDDRRRADVWRIRPQSKGLESNRLSIILDRSNAEFDR